MKKWLVRSEKASSIPYGIYPGSRTLKERLENGIILIDKPPGPTSHQVDAYIKDILNIKKASHGGTLDPRVTGVLVIVLNNATKLMPILLTSKKEYVGVIHLHKKVPAREVKNVFKEFIGKIKQLPPVRSAVARRIREKEIYYLEILEMKDKDILIKVGCEAGTYIRRLADDIGKKLKVGAHLQELRRTKSGIFTEDQCITLQQLIDAHGDEEALMDIIYPAEIVADNIKTVIIDDGAVDAVCNGAPLAIPGLLRIEEGIEKGDWIGLFTLKGELVAIGKALLTSKEMYKGKKGIAIKTDRVLMKKGTYPKMWGSK